MVIVITHLIMLSAGAALYAWARRSAKRRKQREIINELPGHKYTVEELLKAVPNLCAQSYRAGINMAALENVPNADNKKSPTAAATDGEGNGK